MCKSLPNIDFDQQMALAHFDLSANNSYPPTTYTFKNIYWVVNRVVPLPPWVRHLIPTAFPKTKLYFLFHLSRYFPIRGGKRSHTSANSKSSVQILLLFALITVLKLQRFTWIFSFVIVLFGTYHRNPEDPPVVSYNSTEREFCMRQGRCIGMALPLEGM